MRHELPKGKGMCIWIIKRLVDAYGSNEAVASRLKELGISWVVLKIANGTGKYNLRPIYIFGRPTIWIDDIIRPFIAALRAEGIGVWGYQYIYGVYPDREAQTGADRYIELDLDGFVINAEHELKNKPGPASTYTVVLRLRLPDVPIALTSYRYPSYHPAFPFESFLIEDIFHMPQVYWLGANNPAWQLNKSVDELTTISNVPVIPLGLAYSEGGYPPPSAAEMQEFHDEVLKLELSGYAWWEFHAAKQAKVLDFITSHVWEGIEPPEEPTDNPELTAALDDFQETVDYSQEAIDRHRK